MQSVPTADIHISRIAPHHVSRFANCGCGGVPHMAMLLSYGWLSASCPGLMAWLLAGPHLTLRYRTGNRVGCGCAAQSGKRGRRVVGGRIGPQTSRPAPTQQQSHQDLHCGVSGTVGSPAPSPVSTNLLPSMQDERARRAGHMSKLLHLFVNRLQLRLHLALLFLVSCRFHPLAHLLHRPPPPHNGIGSAGPRPGAPPTSCCWTATAHSGRLYPRHDPGWK